MQTKQSKNPKENNYLKRILVNNSKKKYLIDVNDIYWIEASGNYLKVHLHENSYMIRGPLKNIEKKLNPAQFIRIHRSKIINIKKLEVIEPWFTGDFHLTLKNGKKIKMSRNYREVLERFKV